MATLPAADLDRIEAFCAAQWPEHLRDQAFWERHVRGKSVTICETRPPWDGAGDWTHFPIAQLRFRPDTSDWSLHWADRNDRWHVYDPHGSPTVGSCADLLVEVDEDPTAIFKG